MAIVILIEDGSGVANANSYVTVSDIKVYASNRGISLPTSDDTIAALLIDSYEFLNTYECKFAGQRSYPTQQTGAWPRTGAVMYEAELPPNFIPGPIKTAQMQIAIAANSGIKLFPSQTGPGVVRVKVGPIEREFDTKSWSAADLPVLSNVELTLVPFSGDCGQRCGPIWRNVRM